jgi:hypothetical protein
MNILKEFLKNEVFPAFGCTESISIAYTASLAAQEIEGNRHYYLVLENLQLARFSHKFDLFICKAYHIRGRSCRDCINKARFVRMSLITLQTLMGGKLFFSFLIYNMISKPILNLSK